MTAASETGSSTRAPSDCNSAPAQICDELHQCPEVMNPPQSAAQGCEAGNLIADHVMGIGHVHRAAEARPAEAAPPTFSEEQLEAAIEAAKERMCAAPTREGKLRHWREMCRLIDQRTPARRRFMERVRGL